MAVEALENLPVEVRERVLRELAQKDPEIAKKLNDGVWSIDTLVELSPEDFKFLWWDIERKSWLLALRNASPRFLAFVLRNLTTRAGKQLEEDLKNQGPQPLQKVQDAQAAIMYQVREAIAQKKIKDFRKR